MRPLKNRSPVPASDAHLIQLVRTRLGREIVETRINVSSCGFVITLHGMVENRGERARLEMTVRGVAGVEGVVNKLGVRETSR